jgi:hypothetical protein
MAAIDEQDTSRATNDAYTGMLAISLIALMAGCALLYLDWSQYPEREPPKVKAPPPMMGAPAAGAPQQPAGAQGNQPAPLQVQPMPMPMPPMPMNEAKKGA